MQDIAAGRVWREKNHFSKDSLGMKRKINALAAQSLLLHLIKTVVTALSVQHDAASCWFGCFFVFFFNLAAAVVEPRVILKILMAQQRRGEGEAKEEWWKHTVERERVSEWGRERGVQVRGGEKKKGREKRHNANWVCGSLKWCWSVLKR